MICEHCKAEIKEGLDYCQECGEPIEDKIIVTTVADIPLEARPFIDMGGYVTGLTTNVYNVIALLGALCLYLSPFFGWIKGNIEGEMRSADLFDIGAQYGDFAINKTMLTMMGILILLAGILMLAMSGRESIRPLSPYSDVLLVRLIPIVLAVIAMVVVIINKGYSNLCKMYDSDMYQCLGPILCVAGTAIYALSIIMENNKRG